MGLALVLLLVGVIEFNSDGALNSLAYDPTQGWFTLGLFTYCFLHASYLHLFCNLLAITLLLGLEQVYGGKKVLFIFFVGSIVGGLFYHLVNTGVIVGASGGLMAVAALFFFTFPKQKILLMLIPVDAIYAGMLLIIISIIGLYLPDQYMGHACHLGGMMVGLIATFFFQKPKYVANPESTKPKDSREPRLALVSVWLFLGIVSTILQSPAHSVAWLIATPVFYMITFYLGIAGRSRYPARMLMVWSLGVGFMAPHLWFVKWDFWIKTFTLAWGLLIWGYACYPGLIFLYGSIRSLGWYNGLRYYKLRQACQRDPSILLSWAKRCREEAANSPHAEHYLEFAETLERNYDNIQNP